MPAGAAAVADEDGLVAHGQSFIGDRLPSFTHRREMVSSGCHLSPEVRLAEGGFAGFTRPHSHSRRESTGCRYRFRPALDSAKFEPTVFAAAWAVGENLARRCFVL